MFYDQKIWIGDADGEKVCILPQMANRHGLIAGATGTGKTITLKVLAESFSDAGVPVFLADVKGDLSGMCRPGVDSADMQERTAASGWTAPGSVTGATPAYSGTFLLRWVFLSEPPFPKWGPCCWASFWG